MQNLPASLPVLITHPQMVGQSRSARPPGKQTGADASRVRVTQAIAAPLGYQRPPLDGAPSKLFWHDAWHLLNSGMPSHPRPGRTLLARGGSSNVALQSRTAGGEGAMPGWQTASAPPWRGYRRPMPHARELGRPLSLLCRRPGTQPHAPSTAPRSGALPAMRGKPLWSAVLAAMSREALPASRAGLPKRRNLKRRSGWPGRGVEAWPLEEEEEECYRFEPLGAKHGSQPRTVGGGQAARQQACTARPCMPPSNRRCVNHHVSVGPPLSASGPSLGSSAARFLSAGAP